MAVVTYTIFKFDPRESGLRRWFGPTETEILNRLFLRKSSMALRELADSLEKHINTINTTLQRLVEKGVIIRIEHDYQNIRYQVVGTLEEFEEFQIKMLLKSIEEG